MRTFIPLFILWILLAPGPLKAQSSQALFDQANTLLTEGKISEAMDMYRSIEKSGEVSGALFLNMGISMTQVDSLGMAKYYLLKASEFEETEERAKEGLEFVNSQFSRQSATLPKLPWDQAVQWLNEVPGAVSVFLTGFFILFIGLSFLYMKWFKTLTFSRIDWLIAAAISIGVATISLSFYVDYVDQRYEEAVIVIDQKRITEKPSQEANLVSLAYEGYDLTVDMWKSNPENEWLYIRLENGQYGWVSRDGIKIL